jgi:hypothetical protein
MRRVVIGLFALLPVQAMAQECPRGPEALNKGITILFDGLEITYLRQPDGLIREAERPTPGEGVFEYVSDPSGLSHGSWELGADGRPDEATREVYSYDFPDGLPQPVSGSNWSGREMTVAGADRYEALVSWSFGAPETFSIGPCAYEAIRVFETRRDLPEEPGDRPWVNQYIHLTELGMSVFLGGYVAGVAPVVDVPLSIAATAR